MESDAKAVCIVTGIFAMVVCFGMAMCTTYNQASSQQEMEAQKNCINKGCSWTMQWSPSGGSSNRVCLCKPSKCD